MKRTNAARHRKVRISAAPIPPELIAECIAFRTKTARVDMEISRAKKYLEAMLSAQKICHEWEVHLFEELNRTT